MMRRVLFFGVLAVSSLLWTCGPTTPGNLSMNAIELSTGARLEITATNGDNTVGKGVVKLKTTAGTLETESATLDGYGTATVMLACDPVADPACLTGRITATWTPVGAKEPVETEARLSFPTGTGAGAGGGGGSTVEFDGGLRVITTECGSRVPEVDPTCCRTNQEFGKQQPRCPAVQMQPGHTFPINFDGYRNALDTTPFITDVTYNLSFTAPTTIAASTMCTAAALAATLTADFNGETTVVEAGHIILGRITSQLWVAYYDGYGTGPGAFTPPLAVCTDNGGYPNRLAYYVSAQGVYFSASDGTFWRQSNSNEWFFYTVRFN